jgi:hypothetical protein
MATLNTEQRLLVDECKRKIRQLSQDQVNAYNELCDKLNYRSYNLYNYVFCHPINDDSKGQYLIQQELFE